MEAARSSNPVLTRTQIVGLALLAALSLGGYLIASSLTYRLGFPLDDAWIHQTYARNLALEREWAFLPGQPSAGSTAPLWSALLALGFALHLAPYIWTFGVGWLLLWGISVTGAYAFSYLCPGKGKWNFWAGVLLVLEWHLVWASGSGMETLLFALLVLLTLSWLNHHPSWLGLGLLIGLCVWVRPDGITLIGPALLVLLLLPLSWSQRAQKAAWLGVGTLLLFAPYLLFNRVLAGAWWPNTFFAKQAEYGILRQASLISRFLAEAGLPLVGVGAILLVGFGLIIWQAARARNWPLLAGAIWVTGYLFLYAWRLPVTYQHGRYIIPAMPVFFIWAFSGLADWVRPSEPVLWKRVVAKAWLFSTGLVLLSFWWLGARGYGQDVAVIESEMVDTARWVAVNISVDDLVAAHDIGALGYFGNHTLIDLAGLVSPEVIPFIRDESRLAAFLDDKGTAYLVTFPEWYPYLTQRGQLVYQGRGLFSPSAGGENMAVYRWILP